MFINKNSFSFIFSKNFFKKSSIILIIHVDYFFQFFHFEKQIPYDIICFLDKHQLYQIPILHNFYSNFFNNNENYLIYFFIFIIFVFFIIIYFFVFLVFIDVKI